MRNLLSMLLVACLAAVASAEGRLEINQACAEGPGCFPGDPPGFPVRILQAGSYRLTGPLAVTDADQSAILILADPVTLDLAGFEVSGPGSCSGEGASLSCGPAGSGVGIDGGSDVTVRNGSVRGFGGGGIRLAGRAWVTQLRATENSGPGIETGEVGVVERSRAYLNIGAGIQTESGARIEGCHSTRNRSHGIETGTRALIRTNHALENGGFGVDPGALSIVGLNTMAGNDLGSLERRQSLSEPGGNACGDDACSRDGRRLFYLSTRGGDGSEALTLCDAGFHPANLYEIFDPSALQYDVTRGQTRDDSGLGPPVGITGWVRTGSLQNTAGPNPGQANCDGWTSASGSLTGTSVGLVEFWNTAPTSWPWQGVAANCGGGGGSGKGAWCVQD